MMSLCRSRREIFAEAELAHSGDERVVICAITLRASRHASFLAKLFQRLPEGEESVGRRSEAKLAVAFQAAPLREQVETHAPRPAFRFLERGAARDDEGKPRHAFETFIGRGDEVIGLQRCQIERHPAETAHRIDDELGAALPNDLRDLLDRIENAGGRFEMHDRDLRRPRFFGEQSA